MALKMKAVIMLFITMIFLASCQENVPFYEKNTVIPNVSWDYNFKPAYTVEITDKDAQYDVYINLRHAVSYPFSNIYVFLHEEGPGMANKSTRYEFSLAEPDGRWIGKSAGNLYEQTKLLKEGLSFPDTGKYSFSFEQNMAENPLRGVNDVGIKLIKR